jgi:glycerol-3-phosphate O-acyltransferase/dihydroxyacetone phosphate acyltransferase
MLNVFYSSIIIENEEFIPDDGSPCIICANHSNSVMDAVVLVTSVSRRVSTLTSFDLETENASQYGKRYDC